MVSNFPQKRTENLQLIDHDEDTEASQTAAVKKKEPRRRGSRGRVWPTMDAEWFSIILFSVDPQT
jgi:hypothetical protein